MTRSASKLSLSRRHALALSLAAMGLPRAALAAQPLEIAWEDLIPPGLPYPEIIGEGYMDVEADFWAPVFDENATKLNEDLNGKLIRMPGFILPLEIRPEGLRDFVLVPYLGACIHVPPPPPNQLVFVTTEKPWPTDEMWDAVWVTGKLITQPVDTEVAEVGYTLEASEIEVYEWE